MAACCDALIKAACDAGGHDNVTVALCKIVSLKDSGAAEEDDDEANKNLGRKTWVKWGTALAVLAAVVFCVWWFVFNDDTQDPPQEQTASTATPEEKKTMEPINTRDAKAIMYTQIGVKKTDNIKAKLYNDNKDLKIDLFFDNYDTTFVLIRDYYKHFSDSQTKVQCNEKKDITCDVSDNHNNRECLSCTLKNDSLCIFFNNIEIEKITQNDSNEHFIHDRGSNGITKGNTGSQSDNQQKSSEQSTTTTNTSKTTINLTERPQTQQ